MRKTKRENSENQTLTTYLFGAIFASELAGAIAMIVGHFGAIFNAGTAISANIVDAGIL